ncbi:hypothetical protein PUN28_006350 [Cardiocondyla obscurior]|uniref:Uncharacterized protein n=1 Tax=Cardiocondyla obscurior TaxID=286306 RepID=A0AAW2G9W9_9HYME
MYSQGGSSCHPAGSRRLLSSKYRRTRYTGNITRLLPSLTYVPGTRAIAQTSQTPLTACTRVVVVHSRSLYLVREIASKRARLSLRICCLSLSISRFSKKTIVKILQISMDKTAERSTISKLITDPLVFFLNARLVIGARSFPSKRKFR